MYLNVPSIRQLRTLIWSLSLSPVRFWKYIMLWMSSWVMNQWYASINWKSLYSWNIMSSKFLAVFFSPLYVILNHQSASRSSNASGENICLYLSGNTMAFSLLSSYICFFRGTTFIWCSKGYVWSTRLSNVSRSSLESTWTFSPSVCFKYLISQLLTTDQLEAVAEHRTMEVPSVLTRSISIFSGVVAISRHDSLTLCWLSRSSISSW